MLEVALVQYAMQKAVAKVNPYRKDFQHSGRAELKATPMIMGGTSSRPYPMIMGGVTSSEATPMMVGLVRGHTPSL